MGTQCVSNSHGHIFAQLCLLTIRLHVSSIWKCVALNIGTRARWMPRLICESPIGLILCSEGNTEHIEYLMLEENSPIKVAQYYTQLPDKKLLAEKLQRAVAIAKERIAEKKMKPPRHNKQPNCPLLLYRN